MSVTATITSKLTVVETISGSGGAFVSTNDNTVTHNGLDETIQLTGATSVPVTMVAEFEVALVSGNVTVDLRNLLGTNRGAVDGNGLKVQGIKIKNKDTNANSITIVPGAANGYNLLGAAFSITLAPKQSVLAYLADASPDIDATHKTLDISGTGNQTVQIAVTMG